MGLATVGVAVDLAVRVLHAGPTVNGRLGRWKNASHQRNGLARAALPAMGTKRLSVPEAAAYRILRRALTDLRKAERALARSIEHTPPDADQAAYLAAIRAAIATLHLLFASQN
jgi:hypothetical protein